MTERQTAGEISNKLLKDNTKYDSLEVGHALADSLPAQLDICIANHLNQPGEDGDYPWRQLPEFCVVIQDADDPLLATVRRRKFYCSPFLPSPRPDQAVFLYERSAGKLTKRLWVLPNAQTMALLSETNFVAPQYQTMQAWSLAFFNGTFWDYIRFEAQIKILSQEEFISKHRTELIQAGCKIARGDFRKPHDFSKVHLKNVIDTQAAVA